MSSATLSIVALFLAGVIGYYYTRQEEHEGIFGAIVMICCFLIVTPMGWNEEGAFAYIPMTWLGGQGLLTAMIVGFGGGVIYNKLMNSKMTIKLPESVPPMVAEPFKMLIPALATFLVFAAVRYGMSFTFWRCTYILLQCFPNTIDGIGNKFAWLQLLLLFLFRFYGLWGYMDKILLVLL
ncbi:MAG: PTS transporter subunit EIIC [Coprobacillus cateniformis]